MKRDDSAWIVYRVDREGAVLFFGILPTKNLAEEEAEILCQSYSCEWYVSELPLLNWDLRRLQNAQMQTPLGIRDAEMGEYHTGLLANAAVANGSMALPASSLQGMSAQ